MGVESCKRASHEYLRQIGAAKAAMFRLEGAIFQ